MIPLPEYAKIKDNYCISYNGYSKEYVVQLRLLRPSMESTFPGVQVYLSCRDEYMYLLKGEERVVSRSQLKESKNRFAYVREIYCDMTSHPVESFMNESAIPILTRCSPASGEVASCVLLTACSPPVRALGSAQIKEVFEIMGSMGITPSINKPFREFDMVVGVECDELYEAGALGKHVALVPTGFGENLFKRMFPWAQILKLRS